jgi:hypothetical protein
MDCLAHCWMETNTRKTGEGGVPIIPLGERGGGAREVYFQVERRIVNVMARF